MSTDRAKRYAANREIAESRKLGCLFCGSHRNLVPDHLDGFEEHGEPANLAWLCKSCNTRKGAAFRKAGIGRLTQQYNPDLSLSASERRNFLGFRRTPKPRIEQYYPPKGHLTRTAPKLVERYGGYKIMKAGPGAFTSDFDPGTELESAAQWRRLIGSYAKPKTAKWRERGSPRYNPGPCKTANCWADSVRAVLGEGGNVRAAASRIRATPPGQRRKFAAALKPNPGDVPTYAQYAFAVTGYDHGRGEPSLGEIIHRTPPAKRAEYARRIAAAKREHGTERQTGRYRETVPF